MVAETARPAWGFRVRGQATEALEIDIFDVIGPSFWGDDNGASSAKGVREALKSNPSAKAITVRINSAGGDVVDGMAMYQMLADHSAKVTVRIDALAASIASIVAMAGDEIVMADGAFMMIHNPWGFAMGGADDMRKQADVLDKMRDSLVGVYEARTAQPREDIESAMNAETWMTANEAKALGYATAVAPMKSAPAKKSAQASAWNLAEFSRVPDAIRAAYARAKTPAPVAADEDKPMTEDEYKQLLAALGLDPEAKPEDAIAAAKKAMEGDEEEPAEEKKDPPPAEPEAKALAKKIARLTGQSDANAALGTVEGWKASHDRAEVERAAQAKRDKEAEVVERDGYVVALAHAQPDLPMTNIWADPLKATDAKNRAPAEPWASMPLAQLKAYVANMGTRPSGLRASVKAATPAPGAPTSTDAEMSKNYGVSAASAAWARDEMARAQSRAVGG